MKLKDVKANTCVIVTEISHDCGAYNKLMSMGIGAGITLFVIESEYKHSKTFYVDNTKIVIRLTDAEGIEVVESE